MYSHLAVVRVAVDGGEHEVGEEVEGHEGDQQPVGLGPRQLGLGQVHRVEDGDDGQDLGNVPCSQHSQEHEEYLKELQTFKTLYDCEFFINLRLKLLISELYFLQ